MSVTHHRLFSRAGAESAARTVKAVAAPTLALGVAALAAGCSGDVSSRALQPISSETLALFEQKGVTRNAPVLLRAYKKESELEVWKQKTDGTYAYIRSYPMCRWSGQLGPKTREGDRQVPEGFYAITPGQMNPNSSYYLSFNIGYPNAYDRAHGRKGGLIMVHGACSSAGCFSMTDEQIADLYAIAREAFAGGQRSIQMQSLPFKMTAENLAKHRLDPNMPFWRQLKKGSDIFDATRQEPAVGLCGANYGFNLGVDACAPAPAEVAQAVRGKEAEDAAKVAELVEKGVKPVRLLYADGGQHPVFRDKFLKDVSRPDALAQAPIEIVLEEKASPKPLAVAASAAEPADVETKALHKRAMSFRAGEPSGALAIDAAALAGAKPKR
jgi:murein L,D-transpeptidase YafK